MDNSKSSTSVMMAASGDGALLPTFTVFKAQNLYPTWVEGGTPNARYGCSKSGWFDKRLFEEWLVTIIIPYFRNKTGKKVIVGDNLASHFSSEVIRLCQLHNIMFLFFSPPNSTHLFQPLDVAVFRGLKAAWRKVLHAGKKKRGVVPKNMFPTLLREAIESMGDRLRDNIIAGLRHFQRTDKLGVPPIATLTVLFTFF